MLYPWRKAKFNKKYKLNTVWVLSLLYKVVSDILFKN